MAHSYVRSFVVMSSFATLALVPSRALGQTAVWPGFSTSELQTVYLLDQSGTEAVGKLVGLQPDSLLLVVDGTEHWFDRSDIVRLQKRDSLKNGTLIGAAVGVAMGLVAAGITDCPGEDPGGACGGYRVVTFATSVGVYTAMGTGIDALIHGRSTIYTSQTSSTQRSRAARPSPRMALRVGVSW